MADFLKRGIADLKEHIIGLEFLTIHGRHDDNASIIQLICMNVVGIAVVVFLVSLTCVLFLFFCSYFFSCS